MSEKTPTYDTKVYVLDGITYVPHFRNNQIYIGPGYPRQTTQRYSAFALEDLGAEKQYMMLWSRGQLGNVDANNP